MKHIQQSPYFYGLIEESLWTALKWKYIRNQEPRRFPGPSIFIADKIPRINSKK